MVTVFLPLLVQEVPADAIRQEKKKNTDWKGRKIPLPLFTDNMNVYVENPKQSTK